MIAEHSVRQHLPFSIYGIDVLHGRTDLRYADTAYRVDNRLMYTRKYHIIISSHLLCQKSLYARIKECNSPMDSGSIGQQVSLPAFPAIPRTDPGLPSLFFRKQNSIPIRKKLPSVIPQKQSWRHLTAGIHHSFCK